MWLAISINSTASDYNNLKFIIEHGTPKANNKIPNKKGGFTLIWKDIDMAWVMELLSKILTSKAVVSVTIQDAVMEMFSNINWVCTHPNTPQVIGTGMSQSAAFNDYHNRAKDGWYETKLERLITAMKAGIAARQTANIDQKQILQDSVDLIDFVRIVRSGNFLIIDETL